MMCVCVCMYGMLCSVDSALLQYSKRQRNGGCVWPHLYCHVIGRMRQKRSRHLCLCTTTVSVQKGSEKSWQLQRVCKYTRYTHRRTHTESQTKCIYKAGLRQILTKLCAFHVFFFSQCVVFFVFCLLQTENCPAFVVATASISVFRLSSTCCCLPLFSHHFYTFHFSLLIRCCRCYCCRYFLRSILFASVVHRA